MRVKYQLQGVRAAYHSHPTSANANPMGRIPEAQIELELSQSYEGFERLIYGPGAQPGVRPASGEGVSPELGKPPTPPPGQSSRLKSRNTWSGSI